MASAAGRAPWILLPCALCALSGVTVLAPHRAARADAPAPPAKAAPAAYDDGDGDELLEHWGDPKYGREARLQMAGIGVLLSAAAVLSRRRRARPGAAARETPAPAEVTEFRKAA